MSTFSVASGVEDVKGSDLYNLGIDPFLTAPGHFWS